MKDLNHQIVNTFNFKCHMTACCCNSMEIFLNPYDIIQIASNLNLTTSKVIDDYILFLEDKDNKVIRPILKKARYGLCDFNLNKLCIIHKFRPLSCRLFPLARVNGNFYLQNASFCIGLKEQVSNNFEEYLSEDFGEKYLVLADSYHNIMTSVQENINELIKNKYYWDLLNTIIYDIDYFYGYEEEVYKKIGSLDKTRLALHLAETFIDLYTKNDLIEKSEIINMLYIEGDNFIDQNFKK